METEKLDPVRNLRPDLLITYISPTEFSVQAPDNDARLELDSVGYLIFEQFEHPMTPARAQEALLRECGLSIGIDKIDEFISKVEKLGFFDAPNPSNQGSARESFQPEFELSESAALKRAILDSSSILGRIQIRRETRNRLLVVILFCLLPFPARIKGFVRIDSAREQTIGSPAQGKLTELRTFEGAQISNESTLAVVTNCGEAVCNQLKVQSGWKTAAVQDIYRRPGQTIEKGTPLFRIVDPNSLVMTYVVNERDLGAIQRGAEIRFRVQAFPRKTYLARIIEIPSALSRDFQWAKSKNANSTAKALIEHPDGLLPGMTGLGQTNITGFWGEGWDFLVSVIFRKVLHYWRIEYGL
jgi:hypothetical protein